MIEHFGESTHMGSSFSVAKSEVPVYAQSPCVMVGVVGTIECIFLDRSKVRLDDVEPRCIGRCPHRNDLLQGEVSQEILVFVIWQVVHDNIELLLPQI